jgi:acyl transferase domain-containing protein
MIAENSLASAETQSKLDIAHARITLKNEQAARLKADTLTTAAEQEIQRLRTELKLVGMDAKVQRGGIPFATGQVEKRDQWLETRSPEELQELQGAVSRALEGGERRKTLDGSKKRKLSKSHRFRSQSTDLVTNDALGSTTNLAGAGEAF